MAKDHSEDKEVIPYTSLVVEAELKDFISHLKVLHGLSTMRTKDSEAIFQAYLKAGLSMFDMQTACISRVVDNHYRLLSICGSQKKKWGQADLRPEDTICQEVIKHKEAWLLTDIKSEYRQDIRVITELGLQSYYGVPIYVDNQLYGTLFFASKKSRQRQLKLTDVELLRMIALTLGHVIEAKLATNAQKALEIDLKQTKQEVEMTLDLVSDAVLSIDITGRVEYMNHAAKEMLGIEQEHERFGFIQGLMKIYKEDKPISINHLIQKLILSGEEKVIEKNITLKNQEKEAFNVEVMISVYKNTKKNRMGVVLSIHDLTSVLSLTEQLKLEATHDPLTKLPNRVLFQDRLDQALVTSQRYKRSFAVLFTDLDDFKIINDNFGHHHGDKLLSMMGTRLRQMVRESDTVARLGGDEFAVILTELKDIGEAEEIAKKVLKLLKDPFMVDGQAYFINASIGIAGYPEHTTDPQRLIQLADTAMYRAKEDKFNKCQLYNGSD